MEALKKFEKQSFDELVQLLDTPNAIHTEAELEVLFLVLAKRLEGPQKPQKLLDHVHLLEVALTHTHSPLREFGTQQLLDAITIDPSFKGNLIQKQSLINLLIECVKDDSISVFSRALGILRQLGLHLFQSPDFAPKLRYIITHDGSAEKMRVMDLVCDVSNASLENVEYMFTEGWIDTLFEVTEFNFANSSNPDVLVGLNKMELLVKLLGGKDVDVLERFDKKGVIEWCSRSLLLITEGKAVDLLSAEISKVQLVLLAQSFFFGGLQAIERMQDDLDRLFRYPFVKIIKNLLDGDQRSENLGLDLIGSIASSTVGLRWLSQHPEEKLIEALNDAFYRQGDIRLNAIHWVGTIVSAVGDEELTEDLVINSLGIPEQDTPHFLRSIMRTLAQRITGDIRTQIFRLLEALAGTNWGRRELVLFPAFVDFLTNRQTESEPDGHRWKYSIAEHLLRGPESLADDQAKVRLLAFVREGVFFEIPNAAVAIADKNA